MSGSKNNKSKNKNNKIESNFETKWRTIEGFPNYLVSNKGNVYSEKNKIILKPNSTGEYNTVKLCNNGTF